MKKYDYLKSVAISAFLFCVFTVFLIVLFSSFLPTHPLYPVILVLALSCLFIILLFTIQYRKYKPLFIRAEKNIKLHRIFNDLIHASVFITDVDTFYNTVLESAVSAIDYGERGCILLLDPETDLLSFVAAKGYDFNVLKNTYLKVEQTFLYRESNGQIKGTVVIDDPFEYDRNKIEGENVSRILEVDPQNVQTTLSTPIYYNDRLYGMINIDTSVRNAYDDVDKEIIELFSLEITKVLKLFSSLEKVNYYSNYDSMTGLHNRNSFNELLKENHQNSELNHLTYSLVSMDLNNLKVANDSYGHSCGDALLMEFSRGVTMNLPKEATLARYGGDEFLLLLPLHTVRESDLVIKKTIIEFEKHPLQYDNEEIPISFCYGISNYPEDGHVLEKLVQLSDQRMYQRKKEFHSQP